MSLNLKINKIIKTKKQNKWNAMEVRNSQRLLSIFFKHHIKKKNL